MNKHYPAVIILFIAAGLAGCKKDAKQPTKTIVNNNNTLIIGNWARTKTVDTVDNQGVIYIDSVNVYDDYGYVFKSDGTGSFSQSGLRVFDIKYAMFTGKIGINVTQGYNQNGTPSPVHTIPYSVNFVKLTTTQLVLRVDTTQVLSGNIPSHVITIDYYTKH